MSAEGRAIAVLDLTPTGYYADGQPTYRFHRSFPWLTTTDTVRTTPEAAYQDGRDWLAAYERRDPFGNMGSVLGVARKGDGYVGVVNYFHSNT